MKKLLFFTMLAITYGASRYLFAAGAPKTISDLTVTGKYLVLTSSTPWVSGCGTSTLNTGASDSAGTVLLGGSLGSSCVLNFTSVHISSPSCWVSWSANYTTPPKRTITLTTLTFASQVPDLISGEWSYGCQDVK